LPTFQNGLETTPIIEEQIID